MPNGFSWEANFTVFHSFRKASISEVESRGSVPKSDFLEVEDAIEDVVLEREREALLSGGSGLGTESIISCPLLKASDRKEPRSSKGMSLKSAGPRLERASWSEAIIS
jgi:hypothetical protein